jgi:hypothetical protein
MRWRGLQLILFFMLLLSSPAWGALTAHYIAADGAATWAESTSDATPCSWATMLSNATAGDEVRVAPGTYSLSAASTFSSAGTAASPLKIRAWPAVAISRPNQGALATTGMPALEYGASYSITLPMYTVMEGFVINGSRNGALVNIGAYARLATCVVTNAANSVSAVAVQVSNNGLIENVDGYCTGATSAGYAIAAGASCRVAYCRASNAASAGSGCFQGGSGSNFLGCVALPSSGTGINVTDSVVTVDHCTIQGQSGAGIQLPNSAKSGLAVYYSIITDCGYAVKNLYSLTNQVYMVGCRTRDNLNASQIGTGLKSAR